MNYRILILFFTVLFANSYNINCQKIEGKSFVLFYYHVNFSDEFAKTTSSLDEFVKNSEYGENKVKELLVHSTFHTIKEKLEQDQLIFIFPANSLNDKSSYNEYGYPMSTIQKAIRKSDIKYFIRINASYESSLMKEQGKITPIVKLEVNFFDENGYVPIKKIKSEAQGSVSLEINENFLNGFIGEETPGNQETLYKILIEAIEKLYKDL